MTKPLAVDDVPAEVARLEALGNKDDKKRITYLKKRLATHNAKQQVKIVEQRIKAEEPIARPIFPSALKKDIKIRATKVKKILKLKRRDARPVETESYLKGALKIIRMPLATTVEDEVNDPFHEMIVRKDEIVALIKSAFQGPTKVQFSFVAEMLQPDHTINEDVAITPRSES